MGEALIVRRSGGSLNPKGVAWSLATSYSTSTTINNFSTDKTYFIAVGNSGDGTSAQAVALFMYSKGVTQGLGGCFWSQGTRVYKSEHHGGLGTLTVYSDGTVTYRAFNTSPDASLYIVEV